MRVLMGIVLVRIIIQNAQRAIGHHIVNKWFYN
jgi:hypothetical protein